MSWLPEFDVTTWISLAAVVMSSITALVQIRQSNAQHEQQERLRVLESTPNLNISFEYFRIQHGTWIMDDEGNFQPMNPDIDVVAIRAANLGQVPISVRCPRLDVSGEPLLTIDTTDWTRTLPDAVEHYPHLLPPQHSVCAYIAVEDLQQMLRYRFAESPATLTAVVRDLADQSYASKPLLFDLNSPIKSEGLTLRA